MKPFIQAHLLNCARTGRIRSSARPELAGLRFSRAGKPCRCSRSSRRAHTDFPASEVSHKRGIACAYIATMAISTPAEAAGATTERSRSRHERPGTVFQGARWRASYTVKENACDWNHTVGTKRYILKTVTSASSPAHSAVARRIRRRRRNGAYGHLHDFHMDSFRHASRRTGRGQKRQAPLRRNVTQGSRPGLRFLRQFADTECSRSSRPP